MDEWTEIRRKVLVEGASKRSILRDYGIGHQALAKILANPEPPGYQMTEARRKPVLGPFLGVIDEILAADREAPPKQRHTAKRIFERLRAEYGYTGCYSQVQTAVASARRYSKEAFVPLCTPARPCPVRLRRRRGRDRRRAHQGRARGHHAAVLGHLLPLRLSERVHRDLPGSSRGGLRVLRWGAASHEL